MNKISGLLFALGGLTICMGIITAEIFYPGYSISHNFISNLGSSPPPEIIIKQPSAFIFDSSMIFAGIVVTMGGLIMNTKNKFFKAAIIITGIGTAGIGFYPAYHGASHDLIAFVTFAAGGISAILTYFSASSPFKYLSAALGIVSLFCLLVGVFMTWLIVPLLGVGGSERWVAYPVIIWMIMLGGYLMNTRSK